MIDRTALVLTGGPRRRAGRPLPLRRGGRHGRRPKLAGVVRLPVSEHQIEKEKLREVEGEEANPPRWFTRAERGRGGRFAAAAFGEIPSFALRAARVPRVQQMVKGGCGVEGKRFIALGLRKEQGNPEKSGIERGCDGVRLGSDSRKKNRALTGGTGSSAAERREREGVRARAGLAAWWAALTGQGRRGRAASACWAGEAELGRARPKREGKGGEGFGWGFSFFFFLSQFLFPKKL